MTNLDPLQALIDGLEKSPKVDETQLWEDDIFAIKPPHFEDFVVNHLNMPPPTPRQARAVTEPLSSNPYEIFSPSKIINTVVLRWGKGSGKDLLASEVIAWLAYLVCCMKDPHAYLGLAPGEPIDIVNVAPSGSNAEEVFFYKLRQRISVPAFSQFGPRIHRRSITLRGEIVRLFSMHSEVSSWEGLNVLAWILDEASAFRDRSEKSNADEVYRTLRSSARTRFGNRFVGFILSYIRYSGDFICRMYDYAKISKEVWADTGATWDILPWQKREDYAEEYTIDPETADMTYASVPRPAKGDYFRDKDAIHACADPNVQPVVDIEFIDISKTVKGIEKTYLGSRVLAVNNPIGREYFIHYDAAEYIDGFGMAIGYRDVNSYPIIAQVIKWQCTGQLAVDFTSVEETILAICDKFPVALVSSDRYQSRLLMQRLEETGIKTDTLTFAPKQQNLVYSALRHRINTMEITYPDDSGLIKELTELRLDHGHITHPKHGSKDAADCVAAIVWHIDRGGALSAEDDGSMNSEGWAV